jgi:hypothetical protein
MIACGVGSTPYVVRVCNNLRHSVAQRPVAEVAPRLRGTYVVVPRQRFGLANIEEAVQRNNAALTNNICTCTECFVDSSNLLCPKIITV